MSATSFYGGAFFGGEFFNTPLPDVVSADQPSNWQADYWKRRSKKKLEEDELEERIKLGILPAEARMDAVAAVAQADQASRQLASGQLAAPAALLQAMEAREAFERAYREAYKEAYIASVVAQHWRDEMKRITRRRNAIALLLH